jgi:two-component system sensor histidine kinase UhpB
VNGLIDRVRRLSLDLRPPLLEEVGLGPALRAHLDARAAQSGLAMTLETHELDRVAPETEMAAYRLVQEAVTNVLRHAGAKNVAVSVSRGATAVEIGIRDDGRGFVPEETLDRAAAAGHIGLVGMRERARALGGEFALVSRPGAGTTITVRLPVAE